MKITYNENPLRTVVELDEVEKKEFWYKLKIEALERKLFTAHFYLDDDHQDISRALSECDPKNYYGESQSILDQHIDKIHTYYIDALLDLHSGDCTCVPASCEKCHAEYLLGIDTIPGLKKHEASKIGSCFGYDKDKPQPSIDEVIAKLEQSVQTPIAWDEARDGKYWPLDSKEKYEYHIPRWTQERKNALDWLKTYRNQHFS